MQLYILLYLMGWILLESERYVYVQWAVVNLADIPGIGAYLRSCADSSAAGR